MTILVFGSLRAGTLLGLGGYRSNPNAIKKSPQLRVSSTEEAKMIEDAYEN